jgi:hypothetical protein
LSPNKCAQSITDECLSLPIIKRNIALLPAEHRDEFSRKMIVNQKAINGGTFVQFSGAEPHVAPWCGGVVYVDLTTGKVIVGVHVSEKITFVGAAPDTLPTSLQTWINERQADVTDRIVVSFE